MPFLFDSDFIDISIRVFERITGPLPFDVYIRRTADAMTKLFPKGEVMDAARLKSYDTKGVQALYVNKDDYKDYLLFVEQVGNRLLTSEGISSVPFDELVDLVKEMVNMTMFEIVVNQKVDVMSIQHAQQTLSGTLKLLAKDRSSFTKIFQHLGRHPYTIKHSISTAILSIMLAKSAGIESEKSLLTVGLGGLLHDVGMSMLSFDAELKEDLNGEERKAMKEHPELGKRLLDSVKMVSSEVRMIVMQHHEQPNGKGYPNNVPDKQIYYLAKVVAITDSFCALISKRPFRDSVGSAARAISTMREDQGKFDIGLLKAFSQLFITVT